jgi:hypothetical protein
MSSARFAQESRMDASARTHRSFVVVLAFLSACSGPAPSARPIPVGGVSPAPGASGVAIATSVGVAFKEDVSAGSSSIVLSDGGAPVAGTVTFSATNRLLTFAPAQPLSPAHSYDVNVSGVTSAGGTPYDGSYTWRFTTAQAPAAPQAVQVGNTLPPVPDGVIYAFLVGTEPYTVTWQGTPGDHDGYLVERATVAAGPFTTLATLPPAQTAWVDSLVSHCSILYYRVTATSAAGGNTSSTVVPHTFHASHAYASGFPSSTNGTSYTVSYGLQGMGPIGPAPNLVLQESPDGFVTISQQWTATSAWSSTASVTKSIGTVGTFCYRTAQQGDACFGPPSCIAVAATTDNQAPTTPPGFAATGAGLSAVFSWGAATDNIGVAGYRVYEDGTKVLDLDASARSATGPARAELSTHCYQVSAVDSAGNESAKSANACVTFPDLTPPSVPTGFSSYLEVAAKCLFLDWAPSTDNGTVQEYRIYSAWTHLGTPSLVQTLDPTPDTNGRVKMPVQCWFDGLKTYWVTAVDAYGNESALSVPNN